MRPSTWSALPLLLVLTLATAQHEFRFEPGHSLDNLWNMAIPRFGIGPSFSESGDGARGIVYTDLIRSSDGRFLYVCNAMLDKLVVIERNVHTGELLPIQGWEIVITSHLDKYEQVGVNSNGFVMTHDEQHVYVADSGYIPSTIYHFVRDPTTGLLSYFDAEIGCDFDDPVEFDPTEVDLGPLALEPILAKGKAKAKPQTVARVNVGDNGEGGNQCHDASARSYLAISDDDQLLFMSNTPVGQCSEVPSKSSHRIWSLARFSNGTLTDAQSLALGNDEISVPPGAMAWHNGRLVVSHHPSTAYNTCNSGKDVVDTTFIYIYDLETNGTGTRSLRVNDSLPLECTRIPSSSVIPGCSAGGFAFSPARTELYVFRQTHDARSSWEIDGLYVNASGLQFFNLALHDEPFIPPILAKDHDGEEDIRPLEVVPENMREAAEMTTIFRMAADSFSTNVVTWREQPFVHDVCVSEHFFYVSYSATLSGLRFVEAGGDMAELFSLVIYRRDPELGTVTYVQAIPHQWRIGAMDCDDNGVTAATPHGVRVYNLVDAIIDGLEYEVTEAVYRLDVPITPNQPIVSGGNPALFTASPQLPDGLRLDPATGVISGTPTRKTLRQTVMISAGNFNPSANAHTLVTITVQDHLSPCDYQGREYQVRVGESITIPTPSSAVAVTQVDFEVLPPLPPGLALDVHTGDITGTPQTEIPLTNYVVTCAAFGDVQTATVPITVLPAPPSSVSYEIPSMKLELGEPIQRNRVIFSGGRPTFFHSSDIPVGLSVHPVFGYIQGTPEDLTEETEITISYGDDEVNSGDISLLVEVYHKPPTQFTYRNPIAELVVDEEAPPMVPLVTGMGMKFSVDPALPEGLSLDEDTGTISGTPTELSALSGYLVLAWNSEISDGDGARPRPTHVREQLVYISVNTQQPSSFTYSHPNAVYVRGQPITTNVASIAGSAAVFDFRVSPALPTGLLLQANGDITGTPTVVVLPNAAFSIEARNGNNVIRATVALKIVERAPTTISYARTNAAYTVNDPIGENLPVVNEAVDSFSVNTRLPDGLELSPVTGAISGTPTSLQSSRTYVITATNSGGSSSTPLVISVLRNRPRNLTYTYDASQHTFTPSNLGGEILRYVVEPALPFGLILNSKTGQIYGRTLVDVPENQQYTVVGFNEAGSVSRVVDLTVSASAPPLPEAEIKQLHYLYTEATLTIGEAITDNIVISAPIDTIFELDPESQMPLGLNLDTATGTISGTPTIAMPETSNLGEYRVKVIVHCGPYSAHIFYTVPPLPPTIVYDPDEVVFYRGTTIPSVVPITGGGRITVPYTITPAFEFGNGLRFESTRGHINGNPRSVQSKVTYTVTARNSGGLGVGKISITVLERPPVISYTDEIFLQVGRTMTPLAPDTSAGGDVEEYSIIPDLPKGLTLSTTSGVISGAPTATFFQAAFVVTARNSGGSSTASFRLGVTVDGLSEANRFTTVDPISKDTQAETAAGISLTLIFFAFAILLLAFIAWRARNRKTTWQVAREKRDLRLAKALQRYESMVELARQQAAAEEAQRLERERLEAERRKRPLPRNQIPTIPARMIDLFKKLYIPIKLADPLIRENIKVLDLPHLKEDELQRFLPVRKYYRALLKYVENVLIPHVLPSDVLNGSTSSSEDYDDDADLSFSEV